MSKQDEGKRSVEVMEVEKRRGVRLEEKIREKKVLRMAAF